MYVSDNVMGIVAIVAVFGLPLFIVISVALFKYLSNRRKYKVAEKMVEKGQELPEWFFDKGQDQESQEPFINLLKKGLIWLGIGIGVVVLGFGVDQEQLMCIGAIPAFVGVAYLITSIVTKKEAAKKDSAEITENSENSKG